MSFFHIELLTFFKNTNSALEKQEQSYKIVGKPKN